MSVGTFLHFKKPKVGNNHQNKKLPIYVESQLTVSETENIVFFPLQVALQ